MHVVYFPPKMSATSSPNLTISTIFTFLSMKQNNCHILWYTALIYSQMKSGWPERNL